MKSEPEKNAYALAELQRRFGFEFGGMRNHEYYFESLSGGKKEINKDGVLFSKNIDININGSTTSIPIITLFPTNFMSLSKVVVEFEGEVVSINPKTNSLNRRRSSFIIKKNTQNRPMKISTEFIANDQTESYKRIVEKFSNMDIVHGN